MKPRPLGSAAETPSAAGVNGRRAFSAGGSHPRSRAPLKGVEVCAYKSASEEFEENCTLTSPSGEYTISGLAQAEYKVEFWPHREGLNYVTQYYSAKPTFATANLVAVTAPATTAGIDAALAKRPLP